MCAETTLNALRQEIDDIDSQIHDLLIKRTLVVEKVRTVKRGHKVKIRAAREAEILYRLVGRHKGLFPKRELTNIWRQIIVATLSSEGRRLESCPFRAPMIAILGGDIWRVAIRMRQRLLHACRLPDKATPGTMRVWRLWSSAPCHTNLLGVIEPYLS
jgi:chorismate mutase